MSSYSISHGHYLSHYCEGSLLSMSIFILFLEFIHVICQYFRQVGVHIVLPSWLYIGWLKPSQSQSMTEAIPIYDWSHPNLWLKPSQSISGRSMCILCCHHGCILDDWSNPDRRHCSHTICLHAMARGHHCKGGCSQLFKGTPLPLLPHHTQLFKHISFNLTVAGYKKKQSGVFFEPKDPMISFVSCMVSCRRALDHV